MKILQGGMLGVLTRSLMRKGSEEGWSLWEVVAPDLMADALPWLQGAERVVVFAGPGGCGADGLMLARYLANDGWPVEVWLLNTGSDGLSSATQAMLKALDGVAGVKVHEVKTQLELPEITAGKDVVIDALFGWGFRGDLSSGWAMLVRFLTRQDARLISIDMPSGLGPEGEGALHVQPTVTLTLGGLKPSLLMADSRAKAGEVQIVALSDEVMQLAVTKEEFQFGLTDTAWAINARMERSEWAHKGQLGHGLLVAGRWGMAGASILAARAALRAGLGKLTVHVPRINVPIVQSAVPEAVVDVDEENYTYTTPVEMTPYNALAIGPGIGTKRDTAQAFIEQVSHGGKAVVIDADGLNILSEHRGWLQQVPKDAILTPHAGELERLSGAQENDWKRLMAARDLAVHLQIYVVLKGHHTAVCTPRGKMWFNTTGNAGMATAGSGDVLTGILLGLLSQGYGPETAARLGVFLHGLAGDLAATEKSMEALTASDLIDYLPKAWKAITQK